MQQANSAYQENDLLALLRLQLHIEQLDSHALSNLAEERLASYNHALREQSEQLQQQLYEIAAPFSMPDLYKLTPANVQRALDDDLAKAESFMQTLTHDLETLREVRAVKQWLKTFRRARQDDFDIEMLLRDFD